MGRMAEAAGERCQPVNSSGLDMPEFQLLLWAALEELMASPHGIATSLLAVCNGEWLFPLLWSGLSFSSIYNGLLVYCPSTLSVKLTFGQFWCLLAILPCYLWHMDCMYRLHSVCYPVWVTCLGLIIYIFISCTSPDPSFINHYKWEEGRQTWTNAPSS